MHQNRAQPQGYLNVVSKYRYFGYGLEGDLVYWF
jgi:hypothetical protein